MGYTINEDGTVTRGNVSGYPSAFTSPTRNEHVSHLEKQSNITISHQDEEQKYNCKKYYRTPKKNYNTRRKKEVGLPSVRRASQCGTKAGADYINDPVSMRRFANAKISQEYWDRKEREYQVKRIGCFIVFLIIIIILLIFKLFYWYLISRYFT